MKRRSHDPFLVWDTVAFLVTVLIVIVTAALAAYSCGVHPWR